jgi:transcriptional regulator with XRE-family HTH domain
VNSRTAPCLGDALCIAFVSGQGPLNRLPQAVLKQRIEAARTLRGLKQTDLEKLLHEYGFGKGAAGRLERGAIEINHAYVDALSRVLRVPARWFTADDVDEIVGYREPGAPAVTDDQIREGAALLGPQLLSAVRAALQEREPEQPDTDGRDHRKEGEGGGAG